MHHFRLHCWNHDQVFTGDINQLSIFKVSSGFYSRNGTIRKYIKYTLIFIENQYFVHIVSVVAAIIQSRKYVNLVKTPGKGAVQSDKEKDVKPI